MIPCNCEELRLEFCFFGDVVERPESICLLIVERYPSLCRAWSIEEDMIELDIRRIIYDGHCSTRIGEPVSRIHLDSGDDRGSLECTVVEELVIADLVLLDGVDTPTILHHHGELCRLGSWSCTDIEDRLTCLWIEDECWELRCDRLEIYFSFIKGLSSLDRILMFTIEHIGSIDTSKWNENNPLGCEF
jgi:hypothetical protein